MAHFVEGESLQECPFILCHNYSLTQHASYRRSVTEWVLELMLHFLRLVGFLLGSGVAGVAVYSYILDEYKVSNELLTEDIYVRLCI